MGRWQIHQLFGQLDETRRASIKKRVKTSGVKPTLVMYLAILFPSVALIGPGALHAQQVMRERTDLRNARYGEVIIVTGGPTSFTGHVYNTIGFNDCPDAQWKALDAEKIKKDFKAQKVILNGPRYFLMDSNALANPGKSALFNGLEMRHLADVTISMANILRGKNKPYEEKEVVRTTKYTFKKGLPVHELISDKGVVYVMQSYSRTVKPELSINDLATLGSHLKLPKGWRYQVRVPSEDLILQSTGTAHVIQDDLENTYQRAN